MTRLLYIIAGCNGAGKTTASMTILPKALLVREFVNADEIAKGLSPFNPDGVAIEAGRLFLNEVDSWMIYDNSDNEREKIALGCIGNKPVVLNEIKYKIIQSYVRKRF